MFPLLLVGHIALQVWAWRRVSRRLRSGAIGRLHGATRYTAWAFLPVALFISIYLALAGLEEWRQVALIGERTALLALPVLALSALGSIAFAVRCAFVRRAE
jgi:hypothetical protein